MFGMFIQDPSGNPGGFTRLDRALSHRNRCGFTLVEMLVVIAMIALLATLLFPAITAVREKAMAIKCLARQREIGQAAMAYASEHDGLMEGGYSATNGNSNGRRAWYYYLADKNHSYLDIVKTGESVRHCTKNDTGTYGMYSADVTRGCPDTTDTLWITETNHGWPLDPGYVGGTRRIFRVYGIPHPSNTLFLSCTSTGNGPNRLKTGLWYFTANGPWSFNTYGPGCGIWFCHGKKGVNGVFFDGHAQLCSPKILLNVDNHPPCNPVKGIRVWKHWDNVSKVQDGVVIP